jgi:hypothetical protein
VVFLLGVCVLEGVLAPGPFGIAAGIVLVSIAAFYFVFRSGWNRRARDPSVTVPMMLAAICVVSFALYHRRTQPRRVRLSGVRWNSFVPVAPPKPAHSPHRGRATFGWRCIPPPLQRGCRVGGLAEPLLVG